MFDTGTIETIFIGTSAGTCTSCGKEARHAYRIIADPDGKKYCGRCIDDAVKKHKP